MKKEIKDYLHLYLGCVVQLLDGSTSVMQGTLVGVTESEVEPGQMIAIVKVGGHIFAEWDIEKTKPVLRVVEKMTDGDKFAFHKMDLLSVPSENLLPPITEGGMFNWYFSRRSALVTKFLLSMHYDLFDLIPEGLASEWVE